MSRTVLEALWISLGVAGLALVVVMPPATILAWLAARHEFPGKRLILGLMIAPLVLPPTAVGYALLRLFSSDGLLGERTLGFDLGVLLSWRGAVIAAAIMAFPLVFRTARVAFEGVDPRLEQLARTLGWGRTATFLRFSLPMAARGLASAAVLGFTRAVGEFGATVMVAGSIPGRTRTLASALWSAQQGGRESEAMILMSLSMAVGVFSIVLSEWLASPGKRQTR